MNDGILSRVERIFNYSLWTSGDFNLSVGHALVAVLFVLAGHIFGRLAARYVYLHLPKRWKESSAAQRLIPKWIYYTIWIVFILMALRYLGLPMTMFNFLGGAIALGLGFGAQNIFSNLISGIIILISRPFKVGDAMEVNDQGGTVTAIGLRSTDIRTYDGINLLVPNSYFLSNTIVNRSNFEQNLRGSVTITTSYDADSREVDKLLVEIASAQPAVIKTKGADPFVVFADFGDNALVFKLYFWVNTTKNSIPRVSSEIRHMVLKTFREKNISIPFPQLDVHLPPGTRC
ncbi:MAG: mechanosensitive ion channel [Verrucomicrobiota bacterium]|jgi:small-conductance mechanosensitive channel|nr:mechanosensitive ion channel [Verrucomicrobiota bacterium]